MKEKSKFKIGDIVKLNPNFDYNNEWNSYWASKSKKIINNLILWEIEEIRIDRIYLKVMTFSNFTTLTSYLKYFLKVNTNNI